MSDKIYDKIFIGGGLASIFAAYATLVSAREAGKKFDILLLADEIKAPVIAGSHCVSFVEGLADGGVQNRGAIHALLRIDGRQGLENAIAREQIQCRFVTGYEIKARTDQEIASVLSNISDGGRSFARHNAVENSGNQTLRLDGYPYSIAIGDALVQVNTPELLNGLVAAIKDMGGDVIVPSHYHTHRQTGEQEWQVETGTGLFNTRANPFLGTGALHQSALPGYPVKHEITYTAGLVVGPLSDADAKHVAAQPIAFCDVNFQDDVLWGGLDPDNMLTVGKGDLESPDGLPALERELRTIADHMLGGVLDKYPATFNSGAILTAENAMPVVGRLKECDLAGGWAGLGIVAGFAAARAFAEWYVHGDDAKLKIWESMQPGRFPSLQNAIPSAP